MDPTLASNGVPLIWYMNLAYAPLIERDINGNAKPGLATSWHYSADRLSFVMELRKGVKFSDGGALTATAVVNWLKHYKKSGQFTAWLANASDIEATGALEVTIKLSTPDPMLPYAFDTGGQAGDIVSPEGLANTKALGTETHGAGPYMLDKSQTIQNSTYTFVKNPNYYAPSAQHYDKVVVKVFTDQNSVLSALRSGQVQVGQGSATNAAAAKQAGLTVTSAPSGMVGMYIADIDGKITPAFKDVRVRQALNYAIDRKALTKSLYGDYATPTDQVVPEGIGGYDASLESVYPYDTARAKQLLAAAGYAHGFSFTLLVQPGFDSSDLLAQAMAAQWAKLGIKVTIKSFTAFADYLTAATSGKYEATTLQFNYSVQLTDTQQLVTHPAIYNFLNYNDKKANELANDQRKVDVSSAAGVAAAKASEAYIVNGAFLVPVSSVKTVLFSTKNVTGLDFTPYPWPNPTLWKPAQ